ncbi:MAG: DUF1772 domain-containing protein [Gemmatimonadota bacterium]
MTSPPAASTDRPKASWPLMFLALTSLIPFLGFFSGSVAVTWGLLSDRPRARAAVLVGGAGALLNIIGLLVFTFLMEDSAEMRKRRVATASRDLTRVVVELDSFHHREGKYPDTLLELIGQPIPHLLINISDGSGGVFKQRFFEYRPSRDRQSFDIFSSGPDGVPHTGDDLRPTIPDSLQEHTGYRPISGR